MNTKSPSNDMNGRADTPRKTTLGNVRGKGRARKTTPPAAHVYYEDDQGIRLLKGVLTTDEDRHPFNPRYRYGNLRRK